MSRLETNDARLSRSRAFRRADPRGLWLARLMEHPATIGSTRSASNMTKPKKTAKPTGSAADFIPPRATLSKLRAASKGCRGCDLYKLGTQTVFGEGPASAKVMVVGEQPGDAEDK